MHYNCITLLPLYTSLPVIGVLPTQAFSSSAFGWYSCTPRNLSSRALQMIKLSQLFNIHQICNVFLYLHNFSDLFILCSVQPCDPETSTAIFYLYQPQFSTAQMYYLIVYFTQPLDSTFNINLLIILLMLLFYKRGVGTSLLYAYCCSCSNRYRSICFLLLI